ncbi:MAG: polysaccharide pyruvyl transferase family protein, partial [Flavobacteriaceae bacterium]|nr:polysaccharide pyruvyl transferase family protein [Flavobacteriaceae bacterium]
PKINKKNQLGIVPHYNDYKLVKEWYGNDKTIKVIDLLTLNVEQTTNEFLECEHIISSSLHGLIVAHAYRIPAVWVKFSDKLFGDGIKFQDYFESVGINNYVPKTINIFVSQDKLQHLLHDYLSLPDIIKLDKCRNDLIESCPFN